MAADLTLVGDYVRLRPMTSQDADDVLRWRRQRTIARQMFAPPPRSRRDHLRWFTDMLARGDRQEFMIVRAGPDGDRAVGTVGLSHIDRYHGRAEYGILIGEATARRRGLAREASQLVLDHAFRSLRLDRVFLQLFASNTPALKLYRHLGFVREGRLRRHARQGRDLEDVLVMGLLRREWIKGRPSGHWVIGSRAKSMSRYRLSLEGKEGSGAAGRSSTR